MNVRMWETYFKPELDLALLQIKCYCHADVLKLHAKESNRRSEYLLHVGI